MLRGRHQAERLPCYWFIKIQIETFSFEPLLVFPRKVRLRILSMDCSTLTSRTQLASSKEIAQTCSHVLLDSPKIIYRWWHQNEATFLAKGPAGEVLVALAKIEYDCCCPLIQSFSTRYLNTSCNIHGSWEAVQCSRTDYGFKEEQIVTHICWQAALSSRGSPLGHLQTWLEVKSYVVSPLDCICEWNKCTFNCT